MFIQITTTRYSQHTRFSPLHRQTVCTCIVFGLRFLRIAAWDAERLMGGLISNGRQ